MIETILTPTALWKNFILPDEIGANIVQEQKKGSITFSRLKIDGRAVKDGKVSIYAELFRQTNKKESPAILLLEDFETSKDSKLIKDLVSKGYAVLTVDLAGYKEGKEEYTQYPQSINYADYENSKQELFAIKKDAKTTCWYEWCAVLKYAVKYLKGLPYITKVGAFGISSVATALWQVAGSDSDVDAFVLALNSGWLGYKGIYKFGGMVEPQFTNKLYQFIAGVDSQSYAMHIKAPTLLLSATNDANFDVDRAQDTMSKIPEQTYSIMHLSANNTDRINNVAYNNALIFFDKYLCDGKTKMPNGSEIKCEIVGGKVVVEVQTDPEFAKEISKVEVFVSEEMINPTLRCWQKIDAKKGQNGLYSCKYEPYNLAEIVFTYANVEYKNGLRISTNLLSKRFEAEQVKNTFTCNILYSSRIKNSQSIFAPAKPSIHGTKNIDIVDRGIVREKKGPMSIVGTTCSGGLLTFALASKKYKPKNGAMLMLDVFMKEQATLTVKLISDYFGDKTEYFTNITLLGGDVWHNIKIEMNKFKTAEGRVLKDYSIIQALEISIDKGEYLINNALWI